MRSFISDNVKQIVVTATATKQTRYAIFDILKMNKQRAIVTDNPNRSNIFYCFQYSNKALSLNLLFDEVIKGRLQSLLRMCDRFVIRSLLITSFKSHGVNGNTRGRLNNFLLYCKERWRIKSWHKHCCFESFKIKQLILDSENVANRVA